LTDQVCTILILLPFFCFSQGLPNLPGSSIANVAKGAYTVQAAEGTPAVIIVGTGSEVQLCVAAAGILAKAGVAASVVSMPCWELYDEQSKDYKATVFPEGVPVLGVEAAAKTGWEKYTHFQIGMVRFGKSAPADKLYDLFGFTDEKIASKAQALVKHYSGKSVPWLVDAPAI
jgi:transketolase